MAKTNKRAPKVAISTPPRAPKFPAHLGTSPAEWRGLKRTEWREVRQAIERYQHGCAYAPGGAQLYRIQQLVLQISESIETEDWVCW